MPGDASRKNGQKGGRPKGSRNAATLEKDKVAEAFRQRVFRSADRLFDAQMTLAQGVSHLFKIEKASNKKEKPRHVLVTNEDEIRQYLDGAFEGRDDYYYLTTKEPNNQAITDMLNRSLGKPKESVEVGGTDGAPIRFTLDLNAARDRDRDV